MAPVLEAHDVHKSFGAGSTRTAILRGASLRVAQGETVFLSGPSGSGKTTLLSILGCILSPDQGRVWVLGQDVSQLGSEECTAFRRRHLGFVFQNFLLFPALSALDNIRVALAVREMPLRQATERAAALLREVGLEKQARLRPAQLSTGECQRVALARALADEPPVLLADEPTASLDAGNGAAVMQLLMRLVRERGTTLVVVTHDSRIFSFADRILRLEGGRVHEGVGPAAASKG
jgi:putative ABC transport system ATP-binding protein